MFLSCFFLSVFVLVVVPVWLADCCLIYQLQKYCLYLKRKSIINIFQ